MSARSENGTGSVPEPEQLRLSRRRLLVAGGFAAAATATLSVPVLAGWRGQSSTGATLHSRIPLPQPFTQPLVIPPQLSPVRREADADHYAISQQVVRAELIPGYQTTMWAYENSVPGPTIVAERGRRVLVTHTNRLPVPTAVHLHGGVTPPEHDGYPTDLILPEGWQQHGHHHGNTTVVTKTYEYPTQQRAATLWYHDHRMDFTAPAVWRGLAGFHIVTDAEERSLNLPQGNRDLPLAVMDRAFDENGELLYPSVDPTLTHTHGVTDSYEAGVLGDVILVNGRPWPVHQVETALYRLRILNASNARRYRLRFEVEGRDTDLPIVQIGSDHGLLPAPLQHDYLELASAERFDVLIDFRSLEVGSRVTLVNDLDDGRTGLVMRFDVARAVTDDRSVPTTLSRTYEQLREEDATTVRRLVFRSQNIGDRHGWVINGQAFDVSTTLASVALGSTEIWELTSDLHHPVHVHLAPFQVLARGTKSPRPFDHGWKDTIDLRPAELARILVRFDGYRGRYVFHCHNLEHEDMGMMANFDVV